MNIDSHQHFWIYDSVRHEWINDEMKVIKRDFLPEDLLPHLKANQVDGCVAVQADQSIVETKFLLDLAKKNDFVKGVVGWVDLKSEDLEETLESWKGEEKLVGFRHIIQAEPDGFMLNESLINGIKTLAKHGYTYDLLVYHKQLEEMHTLVEKLPPMKLIIDHCAKPDLRSDDISEWKKNMKKLSKFEHLYVKLSGLVTEADWANWSKTQIVDVIKEVVQLFGAERTCFGTDWPVCLLAASYNQVFEVFMEGISELSASDQEKVLGLNAIKFYGLQS